MSNRDDKGRFLSTKKPIVETRKTEERYVTSDPRKMLNMYLAKRVLKGWTEDFVDENTGQVVSIEQNEVLFERGDLIDQDRLAQIRFFMEAGDIKEVEVSNQKRIAHEQPSTRLHPYIAQAEIKDKKHKFLFYASTLDSALLILKDYIELNYSFGFTIVMVKEFDTCIILTDTLKERKIDTLPLDWEEKDLNVEGDNEEGEKPDEKKFYQIESRIIFGNSGSESTYTFVVHTFNVDRAMMIITDYLKKEQDKREEEAKIAGREYDKEEIHAMVESAKPIPVGRFIPQEFSMAYVEMKK